MSDSIDSVTWLVLLRESVDCDRYLRPLIGISSNTGLVRQNKKKEGGGVNMNIAGAQFQCSGCGNTFVQVDKSHRHTSLLQLTQQCC